MDVRCPVCSTEYELDDARVPESGLPVKCSKCGHVFRASKAPPSNSPVAPAGPGQISEWMIRRSGGEVVRFRELTTLQRWIVERKVTRTDEISKTGKKWEKLGNIPELSIFFQVVDAPSSQTPPAPEMLTPPPPPVATDAGRPSQPVLAAQAAAERRVQSETFTLEPSARTGPDPFSETMPDMPGQFSIGNGPAAAPAVQAPAAAPVAPPNPFQPPSVDAPAGKVPVHIDGVEHRAATVPWQSGLSTLDDDVREEYELGSRPRDALLPRRFGVAQFLLIVVALVVAAGAVLYVARPSWVTGLFRQHVSGHSPESVADVDNGYRALRGDTAPALNEAVQAFELAVKRDDAYVLAYAGLAEALTARAELQRELADYASKALANAPATDPAPELAKIAERRRSADADLQRAATAAQKALELDEHSVDANRAMFDLARVRGDTTPIDTYAVRAQANNAEDPRVNLALGAWTMRDKAQRNRSAHYLEAALSKDPELVHAHYLLAKLALDANEKDKARAQLDKVVELAPQHERAVALRATFEEPAAPETEVGAPPAPAAGETDAREATQENAPTNDANAKTDSVKSDAAKADTASGPKTPDDLTLTFSEALLRGEFLRNHDKAAQAVRYYERATKLRPADADAWLGVGWSKLDMHDAAGAVTAFQRALNLSPRFADAHFGIAEAFRTRGNKVMAIRYYKSYLDIAPNGPEAEVARSLVQKMEADALPPTPPASPATPESSDDETPAPQRTPPPPPPPPSNP